MSDSQKWLVGVASVIIFGLIYILKPILAPFFAAGLLAYMGVPIVNLLSKIKFPRVLGVITYFLLLLLIIFLFFILLIPALEKQITLLIDKLPDLLHWLQQTALPWVQKHIGVTEVSAVALLKKTLAEHWQQAGNIAGHIIKTISSSSLILLAWIANLVLIPVVGFYLLRDWEKILLSIKNILPRAIEPTLVLLTKQSNEVVGQFFRGQLMVMFSLGFIYALGLWITGIDMWLLIGIAAGVASIVPYLGFIIGISWALIAAAMQFHDIAHIVYVLIVFGVGQGLESMVLTPLLVGDRVGLHPVMVIFAILVGSQLFGFTGILLAVPMAAIIMVLLRHVKQNYQKSEVFSHGGTTAP